MVQVATSSNPKDFDTPSQRKIKDITKNKQKIVKPGENTISRKLSAFWKEQVNAVDEAQSPWLKIGNNIVKRYRDTRNKTDIDSQRRMNMLWTYTQIMLPSIYSQKPEANVDRTFLDKDPIGRLSARMLERSLRNEMEDDTLHDSVSQSVLDYLLSGRGQVWVRYEPTIGESVSVTSSMETSLEDDLNKIYNDGEIVVDDTTEDEKLESTDQQLLMEQAPVDYIDWRDFYMFPAKARTWKEVQAVGKKLFISKEEAIERFGEEIGRQMRSDTNPTSSSGSQKTTYFSDTTIFQDMNERSIVVYEIWNKTDRRVYWVSTGYDYLCDVRNDPLKLKYFFPCPKPLSATFTNDTVIPVPDYHEWQDQAIQIDELTQRIAMLSRACKVAGTYDASNGGLRRLLNESVENQLIPVDNWALHADKGGIPGSISFLPLDEIQATIATLQEVRQQVKQDLDEVTGISDILRGTTDSRETLGGLRLKNNNAGTRLTYRQNEVARFVRDTIRIVAEIISKHFSDESLIKSSGILFEEELQPASILANMQNTGGAQQNQVSAGGSLGSPPGAQAGAPMNNSGPGAAPTGTPLGAPPVSPQSMGNNIVPFPSPSPYIPQQMPPDPQTIIADKVQKSIDLLRNDIERGFRIDIESDSTIFGDQMQERQDAIEFVTVATKFIAEAGQISTQIPEFGPLAGSFLQFASRRYKASRDLESSINDFCDKMTKKAKELAANPQPSPEQQKAQAEMEQTKYEAQVQAQNDQRDAQKQEANDQREFQIQQAQDAREQQKMQLEASIEDKRAALEREQMEMDMQFKREEHTIKMAELRADLHKTAQEHEFKQQEQHMDIQHKEKEHELNEKALAHKEKEQTLKHKHKQTEQNKTHKEKMKPKSKSDK